MSPQIILDSLISDLREEKATVGAGEENGPALYVGVSLHLRKFGTLKQ